MTNEKILIDVGQKIADIWNSNLTDVEKIQLEKWLKKQLPSKRETVAVSSEYWAIKQKEARSLLGR